MKRCAILVILLPVLGCADLSAVRRTPPLPAPARPDLSAYRIGCPDVLDITFTERAELSCVAAVDVDGSVSLGEAGRVFVQGMTSSEARSAIARAVGQPVEAVLVAVAMPRSGQVFISGPENNRIRVVAYPGPTPVLDFLQFAGSIQPKESKLNDVYVVRPHVTNDGVPRIYHVDVEAVLLDRDPATNILIESSDHIYVGETRRASFVRLLPKWLQPFYRQVAGLMPKWG